MKKKLLILGLMLLLNLVPNLVKAPGNPAIKESSDLMARVELPAEFHPDYLPAVELKNANEADYGNYFLQLIAGGLLYLAAPIAVVVLAIAGLRYSISHGDQAQMDGAKNTIQWALVGLIIIIFSFAIVKAVITLTIQTQTGG